MGGGIVLGAISGFLTGAIIGLLSGDDLGNPCFICFTAEEKALMNGAGLVIPGAIIGGWIGSVKKKTVINGDFNPYFVLKSEMEKISNLNSLLQ